MKRALVCAAIAAACAVGAETISVPAGETLKVEAGRRFEGGPLVKEGAGTLDLSAAVLANDGLVVKDGNVVFRSGGVGSSVTTRYLRFNVTATRPGKSAPPEYAGSGSQFSEFRLFLGGRMLPFPKEASAMVGGRDLREGPWKGFDGDLKTKCYFNPFVVDLGRPVTIDGYSFATANDAIGRDPMSWTLEAGVADGSRVDWMRIGAVEKFEAPKERFKDVGRIFPVKLMDAVPPNYPVTVCGKARLTLAGLTETLERLDGNGLVVLEESTLDVGSGSRFSGSVVGGGVCFRK